MTDFQSPPVSRGPLFWTGWVLSGLFAIMLIMGGMTDVLRVKMAVDGLAEAGYREEIIVPMGIVTIVITILYLIPRTAMFGAILLTGYLGGAVATHVRMGQYGQMFAPIVFAVVMWVALVLRDRKVRTAAFG